MNKYFIALSLLVAPLLTSCVYNNGISKQTDYTITGVTADAESLSLKLGGDAKEVKVTVEGEGEFSKEVELSLEDSSIALLSNSEVTSGNTFSVTPLAVGETNIVCTAKGDSSKQLKIFLSVYESSPVVSVESVSLVDHEKEVTVGDSFTVGYTILPNEASNRLVKFESSNTSIASVNDDGLVTALAAGEAIIKITTVDGGKTDQMTLTVKKDQTVYVGSLYLYGSTNSWSANADYILEKNESPYSDNEWKISFSALAGDEFKVAQYEGEEAANWFNISTSESGVEANASTYISLPTTPYGNITVLQDGKFTIYFDATAKSDGNYKYWLAMCID